MAVVLDGPNTKYKFYQETYQNGKVLNRRTHSDVISVYDSSDRAWSRAVDQHADARAESDCRGCKKNEV